MKIGNFSNQVMSIGMNPYPNTPVQCPIWCYLQLLFKAQRPRKAKCPVLGHIALRSRNKGKSSFPAS